MNKESAKRILRQHLPEFIYMALYHDGFPHDNTEENMRFQLVADDVIRYLKPDIEAIVDLNIPKYNCPVNCTFLLESGGSFDNPTIGGCAIDETLPEGADLEPDDTRPMCPYYQKYDLNKGDDEGLLKREDIPTHLPFPPYYRNCADEDGAMTQYKQLTDEDSYYEGAKAQQALDKRREQERAERIFKAIEAKAMYFQGRVSGAGDLYINRDDWQSLKETK